MFSEFEKYYKIRLTINNSFNVTMYSLVLIYPDDYLCTVKEKLMFFGKADKRLLELERCYLEDM